MLYRRSFSSQSSAGELLISRIFLENAKPSSKTNTLPCGDESSGFELFLPSLGNVCFFCNIQNFQNRIWDSAFNIYRAYVTFMANEPGNVRQTSRRKYIRRKECLWTSYTFIHTEISQVVAFSVAFIHFIKLFVKSILKCIYN